MKPIMAKGEARERILLAAEDLIAKHGVDGVSVRSINAAAGVSAGILHYHFGGLDNVVSALLERHMVPLMSERVQMYTALHSTSQVTVRAVVEILVMPLARKIIDHGEDGARYARFMARLNTDRAPEIAKIFEEAFGKNASHLIGDLQDVLPGISKEVLRLRLSFCAHAMLQSLAELACASSVIHLRDAHQHKLRQWSQVESLIEFLCGGMAAPTKAVPPASAS
ncbi:TetR/AcrR family transcriptional regulator [Burkholderia pyrrocinia]|uniref:TetR/AcrR family transcriptional regulator n=1 Tax=Burkholderia pyrrocinia TaxID=60550 RepID=UPI001577003D|nr:TetR/AcrR family transcriptional regulator [Burkholderia pyrrocinia]NTX28538.1 TetR/AcrR family transcriptional regulator [Burkholderia pyrrocinia]QVN23154.1 TetR/AcrR family transcriptional regulator [Burkholderia pyrrocinia]